MTIIDAHHHVWDLAVRDQDWITGERMAPIRRTFTLDDLRPSARAAGSTPPCWCRPNGRRGDARSCSRSRPPTRWWRGSSVDRPHRSRRYGQTGQAGWPPGRRLPGQHQAPRCSRTRSGLAAPPGRHPRPPRGRSRRPGLRPRRPATQLAAASYAAAAVPGPYCGLDHAGKPRSPAGSLARGRGARELAALRTRSASCPGW